MENAICFEKHDGVIITTLKGEPCDGKDSEGKMKNQQVNFYGQSTLELKLKLKQYKRKYEYMAFLIKLLF